MKDNYSRLCHVDRVIDGDTIEVTVDLGMHIKAAGQVCRLYGIQAPETRGPQRPIGLKSKKFLADLIEGDTVFIQFPEFGKGSFGRWLAKVYRFDPGAGYISVNAEMMQKGFAHRYDG